MAVRIRLRRIGKRVKNRIHFRVTVFDENRGRDGKFLEEIGSYNPLDGKVKIELDRLEHWVKMGAQMSDTVASLAKKAKASEGAGKSG